MTAFSRLFLALCLVLSLQAPALARGLSVAVGIEPLREFVERIGGDLVEIAVMVPAGADPHSYEPRPKQMAALAQARLYFSLDLEFEEAWIPRFQAANRNLIVVEADKGLEKMAMPEHGDHDHAAKGQAAPGHADKTPAKGGRGHQDHEGLDPHIWVSPPLVKTVALNVRDALVAADPVHESVYRANHARFLAEIEALHAELAQSLAACAGARFMVFHPSWGYFAAAYGLVQEPIEAQGKEPSPRQLKALIDEAKEEGIKVVFVQPQFSDKAARTVAKAIGGQVLKIDPLAGKWAENLRTVARTIREAACAK